MLDQLTTGPEKNKFRIISHAAKCLKIKRKLPSLLQFLTKDLMNRSVENYEQSVTFPSLPNLMPSQNNHTPSIYNFCYNHSQEQFQRNCLIKLALSISNPKFCSCVMTLQGDANEILKIIFPTNCNIWLQVLHLNLLTQVVYSYDFTKGRKFYDLKTKDIFLPLNITCHQFQAKIQFSRSTPWNQHDFANNFQSGMVASPMKTLDNLHLSELQYIKTQLKTI